MRDIKFRAYSQKYKDLYEQGMYRVNEVSIEKNGHLSGNVDESILKDKGVMIPRVYFNENHGEGYSLFTLDDDVFMLMQYTGLKDKNGNEIYEGDVIKLSDQVREVVIWNETDAAFQVKLIGKLAGMYSNKYLGDWISCYEVIGNIYENPELMEG